MEQYSSKMSFFPTLLTIAAAAAAKLLQLCLTLCDPMDSSPPGSSIHRILQARILEWGAIAFSNIGVKNIFFLTENTENGLEGTLTF